LTIKVKPHDIFKRDGLNVISEVPITLTEAILGSKLTVDTLEGKLNIEIKPGTNSGSEFILQHFGMPPFHVPDNYDVNLLRGDHILKFKVVIPQTLNEKQRDIFNEFFHMETKNEERFYSASEDQMRNQQSESIKR
jgi:molecular chaperone DnaJ